MLEDIGFYTLSDHRARQCSATSPLWRCEILVTSRCNFDCTYCRGMSAKADVSYDDARRVVHEWIAQDLRHVRFSGGEPTLVPWLADLARECRNGGALRVAVSTNGSAPWSTYAELILAGVDDFSVSLDACCAATGDVMAGKNGAWEKVCETIRTLARRVYVTVGVVVTPKNLPELADTIRFASEELGVADIRIVPAAQWNPGVDAPDVPAPILIRHPILRYRMRRFRTGLPVRGINADDNHRCPLVLDDMAVSGGEHYPCIIALREGAPAIGRVGPGMREDRARWAREHDTFADLTCRENCLDVYVEYNNAVVKLKENPT